MSATDTSRCCRLLLTVVGFVALVAASGVGSASGAPRTESAVSPPASAADASKRYDLDTGKAVALGVVEGVTEFLPISSTGHLLVTQRVLGITDDQTDPAVKEAADAYAIVIQGGAILAVLLLYWRRVWSVVRGLAGRDDEGRRLGLALVAAFVPAAIVGLGLEGPIKDRLFGPWPVVAAWAVGGLALLALSSRGWLEREHDAPGLEGITIRQALIIGAAQCLAMWPGTSRSLVTIVAAILVGLNLTAAVEFSFLLGLLTLGAATAYDAAKHGPDIAATFGPVEPVIGFVAALVAAIVAVKWMVSYLQRHSLAIFGWYRLGAAALTAALLLTSII
jgi:undecaprenyl-diphosphatase